MTVWPSTLPLPFVDALGEPLYVVGTSDTINSKIQRRRRYHAAVNHLAVKWVMGITEFGIFEVFFSTLIDEGAAQFSIDLRYPETSALTNWIVKFLEGYSASFVEGHWVVEGRLELIRPPLAAKAALP